jgi:GntR family transcriptional repressor for pyruvate dehydrogenase complex
LLVETELAGRVAKAPPPTCVAAMRAAVAEMKVSLNDPEAFARADTSFHRAILEGAAHALFGAILKPLSPLAHRYGVSTYDSKPTLRTAIRQHQAILRQIEAGDPAGARQAMSDHLSYSREHYLMLLEQLDQHRSLARRPRARRR